MVFFSEHADHGALLCSALQVTPMSHLHPTHHALHITSVSAPVLKWGLALVSTGEAWMGQTLALGWGPPEQVPRYVYGSTDGCGNGHI